MRRMRWMRVITFTAAIVALTATTAYAGVNRWTRRGLEGRVVNCLVVSPTNPPEVYAGAYTSGARGDLQKTTDGGQNWAAASSGLEGMFVRALAMDTSAPEGSLYAVATSNSIFEDQLFSSADRGQTWASLNRNGTSIVVNPANPRDLYSGHVGGIGYSRDGGAAWKEGSISLRQYQWIAALALDPHAPSTIYASGWDADMDYPENLPVFKSTDAGTSWRAVGGDFLGTAALAVDPSDSSHILAGTWTGIFVSGDAGQTWSITSPERTFALAVDPVRPEIVYAGTATAGVQRSLDHGLHWTPLNSGLMNRDVFSLAIDASGLFLYAGTADGVFGLEVASGPLDVSVAKDGDIRFFSFDVSSGRIVLGAIDPSGQTALSRPFGPYSGWTPRASADGNDGVTRILWTHEDGSVALWLAGPLGVQASFRYEGTAGLTAIDVAAGSDTQILWTGTDGAAVLQTIDASGGIARSLSFGPYDGWSATSIADGPDGLTRVLWNNSDGRAGLSLVSSDGILTTARYVPVAGWTALDVAVGGDGLTRILRAHDDGRITVWIVNVAGEVTQHGEVYPAPVGFVPGRIATAPDGSSRLLFTGSDGSGILWRMSADAIFEEAISLLPVLEPPPVGISSGTGSQTWTSIATSRALCPEITAQVGTTYPLWITVDVNGSFATLSLGEEPPSNDPMAEGPGIFRGTISGNSISASYAGPFGGFACPGDGSITRRTGGNLTATLSGKTIGGQYTEIYGNGADAVTLLFRFDASF